MSQELTLEEGPPSAGPQTGAAAASPHPCSLGLDPEGSCFRFTIPGEPVPKARPRMTRTGHTFTPKNSVDFENRVRMSAFNAIADQAPATQSALPYQCPLHAHIYLVLPSPKSWPKWKLRWLTLAEQDRASHFLLTSISGVPHTSRPDMDNLEKAILDGMNGIVYQDDALVASKFTTKLYGTQPRAYVTVSPLQTYTNKQLQAFQP